MSLQTPLGVTDRHNAGLVMINGSTIKPFYESGDLTSRTRRQQGAMMFQQCLRNGADLARRLPFAENYLGESLP
jgi:hypothetical protein